jgi:hypothetical protein
MSRLFIVSISLAVSLNGSALAASRDEQTAACKSDALKFCASEIPNEQKITVCMKANVKKLSPQCKAMFRQPGSSKS